MSEMVTATKGLDSKRVWTLKRSGLKQGLDPSLFTSSSP